MKKVNKGNKGSKQDVSIALKRTLFNQLQLSMKRSERQKMVQENRLLQRRATLHTEQLSLTNLEKRKKILPKNADPRSISPRSTRSIPSYARPTKAAAMKERDKEDLKLPKITNNKTSNKSSSKSVTSSRRKSTKSSKTARWKSMFIFIDYLWEPQEFKISIHLIRLESHGESQSLRNHYSHNMCSNELFEECTCKFVNSSHIFLWN